MRTLALLALAALVTGAGGAHAQANLSPRYKGVTSEKLSVRRPEVTAPSASDGLVDIRNSPVGAFDILSPQQPPSYFTVEGVRSTVVNPANSTA